jgi:flagellar biosynthesis component FlhA
LAHNALSGEWPESDQSSLAWAFPTDANGKLPELLALICCEAIRIQPSVLLTGEVIRAYSDRLVHAIPEVGTAIKDDAWLEEVLKRIVDLGIGISDLPRVGRSIREHEGSSACETAEAIIGELASETIGLIAPEEIWPELGSGDLNNPEDLVTFVQTGMLEETGIVLPRVVLEHGDQLPARTFAIRLNDLTSLPTALLPPDICLVNDTSENLQLLGESARPAINPATGQPASLAPLSSRERLEAAGLTTWSRAGHVILQLAATVRRHLHTLVSQDRMLAQLDILEELFPAVVRAARAQLSPAELAALLRKLAGNGVPLRDLVPVLERVVDLPIVELNSARYWLLNDPVYSTIGDSARTPRHDPQETFVRAGLRNQIAQRFASEPGTLVAYLLDANLEKMASESNLSESDENRILDAIARELRLLPKTASVPVILTTANVRGPLQQLVRASHPLLVVLAYQDLPASIAVQPVARISLDL